MPFLLFALYLLSGLLCIGLALPLIRGRVPTNRWYGFRTSKTLFDETTWYKANAYAGQKLLQFGLAFTCATILLFPIAFWKPTLYALLLSAISFIGVAVMVNTVFRYLKRL